MVIQASFDMVRAGLIAAAETVIDRQDLLTKADQAIGDGDHGIGMARGFKAFREAMQREPSTSLPELFKSGGLAIMMTSGGASGVIFGTLFIGASKRLEGEFLDSAGLAAALSDGLEAVSARGKAKPGDKTMIDALFPASEAAAVASRAGYSVTKVAASAATAAEAGMDATKSMIATTGKAKSLGERSLGFIDPGALTFALFLRSFARSLSEI
jgi:dihydroxyacetone kinase-like protein